MPPKTYEPTIGRRGDAYVSKLVHPEHRVEVVVIFDGKLLDLPRVQDARDLRDALNDVLGGRRPTPS